MASLIVPILFLVRLIAPGLFSVFLLVKFGDNLFLKLFVSNTRVLGWSEKMRIIDS